MQHYNALEITRDATQNEIEKALTKLVILYHPEQGGKYENFMKILESYYILKDRCKKRFYHMLNNTIVENIGILDTILLILTETTALLFSVCLLLLALSIYLLPLCIFHRSGLYLVPLIALSQLIMSVAFVMRLLKMPDLGTAKIRILKLLGILSLIHILGIFYLLWIDNIVHFAIVWILYAAIDFKISRAYYLKKREKKILILSIYRIACVTSAFLLENLNLKLCAILIYVLELGFISRSMKGLAHVVASTNYVISIYLCSRTEFTHYICAACSMNFIFLIFWAIYICRCT